MTYVASHWPAMKNKLLLSVGGNPPSLGLSASTWWTQAAAGTHDSHYLTLADNINAAGITDTRIVLCWEQNGAGVMPWEASSATGAQSTAQHDYVTFWRRIVPAMRARQPGVTFRFVWCPGTGDGFSAGAGGVGCEATYPGDDVVDEIAFDGYDVNASASGYGQPGTSFPIYSSSTSYTAGTSKVSYKAGYYVAARSGILGTPPTLPQTSNSDWTWYPQSSFTAPEAANVLAIRNASWTYVRDPVTSTHRTWSWVARFAAADPTLLSGLVLDSRATRAGTKPLGIHEFGLMGKSVAGCGGDNPVYMASALAWMRSVGLAWVCVFTHNNGLPNASEWHGIGPPDGDTVTFPTAPPLFGQLAGDVWRQFMSAT
jgi:hypothetical protein